MKRIVPELAALPRPVFGRNESLAPGMWTETHSHPWCQLSYAVSGVLAVTTPQGDYVAPPRYAVWIPPGVPHQVFNRGRTEMRSLYLAAGAPGLPEACAVLEVDGLLRISAWEFVEKVCKLLAPAGFDTAKLDLKVKLDAFPHLPPLSSVTQHVPPGGVRSAGGGVCAGADRGDLPVRRRGVPSVRATWSSGRRPRP